MFRVLRVIKIGLGLTGGTGGGRCNRDHLSSSSSSSSRPVGLSAVGGAGGQTKQLGEGVPGSLGRLIGTSWQARVAVILAASRVWTPDPCPSQNSAAPAAPLPARRARDKPSKQQAESASRASQDDDVLLQHPTHLSNQQPAHHECESAHFPLPYPSMKTN